MELTLFHLFFLPKSPCDFGHIPFVTTEASFGVICYYFPEQILSIWAYIVWDAAILDTLCDIQYLWKFKAKP